MGNLANILRDASQRLDGISATPCLDAELLMAHALGLERSDMLLRMKDLDASADFAGFLERRMRHEPVAYITGKQAFWDIELEVTPDVLIPRSDSETLIEAALKAFPSQVRADGSDPLRILDLGTGSGALLLASLSLFPQAIGVGMDASVGALSVAQSNARRLGFDGRAEWLLRNWREEGWCSDLGRFELILCNPPYVEARADLEPMVSLYEPHDALFAGEDGLDDYRIIVPRITKLLAPEGVAIFEIGHSQADSVSHLASSAGLSTELRRDLSGKPRVLRFSLGIGDMNG